MSRWGTVSAHSGGERWTRWGRPKASEPQQEPAGVHSVYLPEPVYSPIPAARPAQPARQQQSQQPASLIPRSTSLFEYQERQRAEKRHAELERQSVAARQLQAAREDAEFQSYLRLFFGHSESEVIVAHSLWLAASDTRRKNLYASARRSFDAHSGTSRVLQHMRSGQSGGAKDEQGIAERERIEAELAILARPQPKLFTLEDCLQKQALWQLERLGRL